MSQNMNLARPSRRQFLEQSSLGLAGMVLGESIGGNGGRRRYAPENANRRRGHGVHLSEATLM